MKVLVDECAPKALSKYIKQHGHECRTVQDAGWSGKQNGELLDLAEEAFNAFVTVDANLRFQQNLARRKIAIIIIQSASNRLEHLVRLFPICVSALDEIKSGQVVVVGENT